MIVANHTSYIDPVIIKAFFDKYVNKIVFYLAKKEAYNNFFKRKFFEASGTIPVDRQKKGREPITAALLAAIYKVAGVDNMMFMDIHSEKIVGAFNVLRINTDNLRGSVVLIDEFKKTHVDELENLVVLSPDVGGGGIARYYSRHLEADVAIGDNVRNYQKKFDDKQGVEHITIMGDVKDKNVLILDDIIDTASTIIKVTKTASEKGARKIYLLATHAILSGSAVENLNKLYKAGIIQELITTDTITRSKTFKNENPWYKEISVATMFAETVYNMNFGRPVHGVYED